MRSCGGSLSCGCSVLADGWRVRLKLFEENMTCLSSLSTFAWSQAFWHAGIVTAIGISIHNFPEGVWHAHGGAGCVYLCAPGICVQVGDIMLFAASSSV